MTWGQYRLVAEDEAMKRAGLRRVGVACALGAVVLAGGCKKFRRTTSAPKSEQYAGELKLIVASHTVKVLHVPDTGDYAPLVQTFYDDRNYEVAWVEDGKPSAQAQAFITAFKNAADKGLNPADFDAGKWDGLVAAMKGGNEDAVAEFDAAMTVSVMRYISDLRIGRVNPTHFNFDIDTATKKYNLPEFVSDNAVDATDVPKLIESVEPNNVGYQKLEAALPHYIDLAKQQAANPEFAQPLPTVTKPVAPGGNYAATGELVALLQMQGNMPSGADGSGPAAADGNGNGAGGNGAGGNGAGQAAGQGPGVYTAAMAEAVKQFQAQHGYVDDGKLTAQTVAALNVPMSARVQAMDDTLERWRWLPEGYVNAPLMVNLPEFVVRGYGSDQPGHATDFTMKVVDGKEIGDHQTPVFTQQMKYVIFRPFWNVPLSIVKKELAKHIEKSGMGYLAAHNFETVNAKGEHVDATAAELERGAVLVREKPGPKNSLGLVKFMFPNEYDIYLHSTPEPELFNRSKRDFSHGCVRVQKPDELAVWVLKNTPGDWTLDKVHDAFADENENNKTVTLKQQIPIVLFYATAEVGDDGAVHFFDDVYGYDKQLNDVLSHGMPYPAQQQKVNPNAVGTPGDTV